jgi:hypothetical protein
MNAYRKRDYKTVMEEVESLQNIAIPEQNRVLLLLPLLFEKYSIIGGLEFLQMLPSSFDNPDLQQEMPLQEDEHEPEDQVRFLLALADYQQEALSDICSQVAQELNSLGDTSRQNEAKIAEIVDEFFLKHGMAESYCTLDAYQVKIDLRNYRGCRGEHAVTGKYEQCGFSCGCPCFRSQQSHEDTYLYWCDDGWSFSSILGGTTSNTFIADENDGKRRPLPVIQEGDKQNWQTYHGCGKPEIRHDTCEKRLQDAMIDFLRRRKAVANHLSLNNRLVDVHLGPPKGFDRALQKGVAWLRDLNRSTLVFDSPSVLVLGFKLLEMKVKALGGELVRLSNLFMRDGTLDTEPQAPPCLHLNFKIGEYIYEVMLMLSDFATAKHRIHKFYELARAKRPIEVAKPVFDPLPLDGGNAFPEGSMENKLCDSLTRKMFQESSCTTKVGGSALKAASELKKQTKTEEKEMSKGNRLNQLFRMLKQNKRSSVMPA